MRTATTFDVWQQWPTPAIVNSPKEKVSEGEVSFSHAEVFCRLVAEHAPFTIITPHNGFTPLAIFDSRARRVS